MQLPEAFLESLPIPESEKADFIASLAGKSPITIRLNTAKAKLRTTLAATDWCANGYYLPERPRFTSDPAFHAGAYYPQEASSMFLSAAIGQLGLDETPLKALDLCAAPGGKSTILRSQLHPDSLLVSNEVIQSRVKLLEESLVKWGQPGFLISNSDPSHFTKLEGFFDLALVDAPCSGEGLFRKQPDALSQWSPQNVQLCAARQKRILSAICPAVAENGILIYSTCTYNKTENEENMDWLAGQADFEPLQLDLKEFQGVEQVKTKSVVGYRFMPHRVGGEGLFLAVYKKRSSSAKVRYKSKSTTTTNKEIISGRDDLEYVIDDRHNTFAIKKLHRSFIEILQANIRVSTIGFELGRTIRDDLKPGHGYSQIIGGSPRLTEVELGLEDALAFLEKNDVAMRSSHKGELVLVKFEGFRLGLAKTGNGRLVSNYPIGWRVRSGRPEKYIPIVASVE